MSDDSGVFGKMVMSAIVVVFMIPGLIVEPGPISEIVGVGALAAIWGFDEIFE